MTQTTYKLIPFPNEEGEYIAVSDEESFKLKKNLPYYSNIHKKIFHCIHDDQFLGLPNDSRITASTKFIHPSIPLMRKEQIEFDENAKIEARKHLENVYGLEINEHYPDSNVQNMFNGFVAGYNAGIQKNKFDEGRLKQIIARVWIDTSSVKYCICSVSSHFASLWIEDNKEYLQSLNKPKEWIVTFEMEQHPKNMAENNYEFKVRGNMHIPHTPKLYKEGENTYVNITSIKSI
jgi:hypothetical protein